MNETPEIPQKDVKKKVKPKKPIIINIPQENNTTLINKGGQPVKISTENELKSKVQLYLLNCEQKREMPNKAGLCVFLKISRETYYEYRRNRYIDAIKEFEAATQDIWVQRLGGTTPTGAIFYLKNAFSEDFSDNANSVIINNNTQVNHLNVTALSTEELKQLSSIYKKMQPESAEIKQIEK